MLAAVLFHSSAMAQIIHEVFLPNTDHELNVYRIFGEEPGKTIMLIGGIQGDEPGSYLTADLYADIHLKKGNLIVVPRANFYSILLSRREGLTGDMNRKFGKNGNSKKA
jgi:predicted deacylase